MPASAPLHAGMTCLLLSPITAWEIAGHLIPRMRNRDDDLRKDRYDMSAAVQWREKRLQTNEIICIFAHRPYKQHHDPQISL